jgi:hypothetical protein
MGIGLPILPVRTRSSSVLDANVGSGVTGSSSSSSGGSSGGGGDEAAALVVIVVVALVLLVLFGAAGYLVYSAPSILSEILIEAILASILTRSSRKIVRAGWSGSVWSATWKPAAIVLVVVVSGGYVLQHTCEGQTTLRGVLNQCFAKDSTR